MKILILVIAILGVAQVHALPLKWNKITDCNNDLFIEEAMVPIFEGHSEHRPIHQLVLRGKPLRYFVQLGAIDKKYVNNKGEFILRIYSHGYGEFSGSTYHGQGSTGSYIFRSYKLKRDFNEVSFHAYLDLDPDANEMGSWGFLSCRFQPSEP